MRSEWKARPRELLGLADDASPAEVRRRAGTLLRWLQAQSVPGELAEWAAAQKRLARELLTEGRASAQPQARASEGGGRGLAKARGGAEPWFRTPLALAVAGVAVGLVVVGLLFWLGGLFGGGENAIQPSQALNKAAAGATLVSQVRLSELEAAVAANPRNAAALFELGESYMVAGEWEKAIQWFTRLLAVDPDNLHARTDIGTAHMNLGRYAEAEATFLAAQERSPDDLQINFNLGWLFAFRTDAPDRDRAARYWQRVISLAPNSELAAEAQRQLERLGRK